MYSFVTIYNVWKFKENKNHLDQDLYCGSMWRDLYELDLFGVSLRQDIPRVFYCFFLPQSGKL